MTFGHMKFVLETMIDPVGPSIEMITFITNVMDQPRKSFTNILPGNSTTRKYVRRMGLNRR